MIFSFENFEADDRLFQLRKAGQPLHVEPRVFQLLLYLIAHRQRVISKNELLDEVWSGTIVSESSLYTCIKTLRSVLSLPKGKPPLVKTVHRVGYQFTGDVQEREETRRDPEPPTSEPEEDRFVGRADVLVELRGAVRATQSGRGRLVLLSGEAGIGKTRTAEQVAAEAKAAGSAVIATRCPESEATPALWPWRQVVYDLVAGLDVAQRAEAIGERIVDLRLLAPELVELDGVPEAEPDESKAPERFRLFEAVARLLRFRASSKPVLLFLDDIQWADVASLELLGYLAHELSELPVLVLATLRDPEPGTREWVGRTLSVFARLDHCRRIELLGFSEEEVAYYLTLHTEAVTTTGDLVRTLRERTEGNPLFLRELVQLTARSDAAGVSDEDRLHDVPPGVRDVIARRFERMAQETLTLLRLAAVIGREFSLPLLVEAAGATRDELLTAMDEANDAGILKPMPGIPGCYRFSHALVRDVLYDALSPRDRARAHEKVGKALEKLSEGQSGPHLSDLAHHFHAAAELGHEAQAVDYSVRAAKQAYDRTAFEEAARLYGRASDLLSVANPGATEKQLELKLAQGESNLRAGDGQRTRESFGEAAVLARQLNRKEEFVRAAVGYGGSAAWGMAPDTMERQLLEEAETMMDDSPLWLRAKLASRLVGIRMLSHQREGQQEASQRAIEMARESGDPAAICEALRVRRIAIEDFDHLEERFALAEEILRLARGYEWELPITFSVREADAVDRLCMGDRTGFLAGLADVERAARQSRHPSHLWLASAIAAGTAILEGRFADAEQNIQVAMEWGERARNPNAIPLGLGLTFALKRERGELQDLVGIFETVGQGLDWIGHYPRVAAAVTFLSAGRLDEAREIYRPMLDELPSIIEEWIGLIGELAWLSAALDDPVGAERIQPLLEPYEEYFLLFSSTALSAGPVAGALAQTSRTLGDVARALDYFDRAISICERVGATPARTRVQCEQAELLIETGDTKAQRRGQMLAAEALAQATQLGMKSVAERATRLRAS